MIIYRVGCVMVAGALLSLAACQQQPSKVKVHHYGNTSGGGSLGIHTLKPHENLWTVAQAYRVDLRDLLELNRLHAPYKIQAGARLRLPAPQTYKVQSGDTIYSLSRLFQTTTTELARINRIKSPYVFKAGQVISLPGRHMAAVETVSTHGVFAGGGAVPVAQVDREVLQPAHLQLKKSPTVSIPPVKADPRAASAPMEKAVIRDDGQNFLRPVDGSVLSGFGPKAGGLHNDGVNIRTARGAPVRAAKTGQVVYTGHDIEGYGNLILIRHANGYVTAYAHLDKVLANRGAIVQRGQVIGKAGNSGHVKTPQLHFEIRKGREAIDPAPYL